LPWYTGKNDFQCICTFFVPDNNSGISLTIYIIYILSFYLSVVPDIITELVNLEHLNLFNNNIKVSFLVHR